MRISSPVVSATTITTAVWAAAARKLTNIDDVRAALIDNLDASISSIDATADVNTLLTRLTADRASKLDYLDFALTSLNDDLDTLLSRLSATKSGYIDAPISTSKASTTITETYNNTLAAMTDLTITASGFYYAHSSVNNASHIIQNYCYNAWQSDGSIDSAFMTKGRLFIAYANKTKIVNQTALQANLMVNKFNVA